MIGIASEWAFLSLSGLAIVNEPLLPGLRSSCKWWGLWVVGPDVELDCAASDRAGARPHDIDGSELRSTSAAEKYERKGDFIIIVIYRCWVRGKRIFHKMMLFLLANFLCRWVYVIDWDWFISLNFLLMAEILDPIYESPLSRCGAVGKLPTFRVESLRVGHVVLACSFPISCNAAVAFCRLRTNIHWQKNLDCAIFQFTR